MKLRPYLLLLAILAFIFTSQFASAATFIEDFSTPKGSGWSGGGNSSGAIGTTDEYGSLEFSVENFGTLFLLANAVSSGGQFSGDFVSRGVTGFSFDLFLTPESTVTQLRLELAAFAVPDYRWSYSFGAPTHGEVTRYSLSIEDSSGWTQVSGDTAFGSVISSVYEFMIILEGSPSFDVNASGYLDNVAVIPEPNSMILASIGIGFIVSRRRRVLP